MAAMERILLLVDLGIISQSYSLLNSETLRKLKSTKVMSNFSSKVLFGSFWNRLKWLVHRW